MKMKHIKLFESFTRGLNENTIPQTLFWMSCDGNKNTLSPASKNSIKDAGEEKGGHKLYYFSQTPLDKGEKDKSFDVVGCVGVDKCVDPKTCTTKFYIDEEGFITSADML